MGLADKTVEINLMAQNISYYENLGYKIPREIDKYGCLRVPRGTKLTVDITDLPHQSGAYVNVKCDNCNKIYKLKFQNYTNRNHNGLTYCKECAPTIFLKGENNPCYNKDLTEEERVQERDYYEYHNFIKQVLERDKYTCQMCGIKGGDLRVHHLDGYNWCTDKRTDTTNGITLCKKCHSNFHSFYGYGNNTKQQFEEWIGKTITLVRANAEIKPSRQVYCYEDDIVFDNVLECAKHYNTSRSCVYGALNGKITLLFNKNFFWNDVFINASEEEKQRMIKHNPKWKKVVCLTTGEVFDCVNYANAKYGVKISKGLNGRKHCGKLFDGTRLQWMYYKDFIQLPLEEQTKILKRKERYYDKLD